MRINIIPYLFAGAVMLLASCSTPKNVAYFQNLTNGAVIEAQQQLDIKVRPDDKLLILVSTQDPALSALFNLVQSQTRLTTGATGSNSYNTNGNVSYYTVDKQGDITFPVLGRIHIAGMTRGEVASYIEGKLMAEDLVKQPVVTVEFVKTGVAVIGEVGRPGRYEFNKDRITIIEALSLAGDLKVTGQRENVAVVRKLEDGAQKVYRVDLTDMGALAASPVYYLQQDDIVYVEPNAKSKRETTSAGNTPFTPSFWLSVGSIGLTVATLIVTLTK